ncbi:MAG: sulfotransferase domain-containing protein [Gammaproteobacteria bacterium]|nr:sulfotransferase domain-containing protein [Gammaproteobacteria bacterium]
MQQQTRPDPRWGEWSPFHDPRILANFSVRPTDVLITTAPKAGTTWMQQILYQLKTGGVSDFDSIHDAVPWLELPRVDRTWPTQLEYYETLPDPRIFKTHCTYPQTPGTHSRGPQNPYAPAARIILSSRDPRDCCVSFYHHVMSMTDAALKHVNLQRPRSFDDYFTDWISFGAWYRNVQSWWPHINDDNVLWLRYEDMVNDLDGAIERILGFLGWQLASASRCKVLEYCSFTWMKQRAEKFVTRFESGESMFKPGGFIRKGQTGDHKVLLSPAQEQQILQRARELLPGDCLRFVGIT